MTEGPPATKRAGLSKVVHAEDSHPHPPARAQNTRRLAQIPLEIVLEQVRKQTDAEHKILAGIFEAEPSPLRSAPARVVNGALHIRELKRVPILRKVSTAPFDHLRVDVYSRVSTLKAGA